MLLYTFMHNFFHILEERIRFAQQIQVKAKRVEYKYKNKNNNTCIKINYVQKTCRVAVYSIVGFIQIFLNSNTLRFSI